MAEAFGRGLTEVNGDFDRAEVVEIVNPAGKTIARGISRFGKEELLLIQGKTNADVLDAFPGRNRPEVVHRDHLAPLQTNLD